MFASLEYVVWVKWSDRYERHEAFASAGRAKNEAETIAKEYKVDTTYAHCSKKPFSAI